MSLPTQAGEYRVIYRSFGRPGNRVQGKSSGSAAADPPGWSGIAQMVPKPTGRGVCAPISTYASEETGTTT